MSIKKPVVHTMLPVTLEHMAAFPEELKTLLELITPQSSARAVVSHHTTQGTAHSSLEDCGLDGKLDVPGRPGHFQLVLSLPNAYVQGSLSKMCGGEVSSIG